MANKPTEEWMRAEIAKNIKESRLYVTEEEIEKMVEILKNENWSNPKISVWECLVLDAMMDVKPSLEHGLFG